METPIIKSKKGISPIWILPFVALLIGGWLLYKDFQESGIMITVRIKNASGLLKRMKDPGRKYIIVESKRYSGLESTLKDYKDKIEIIDRSSSKWYLVRINE